MRPALLLLGLLCAAAPAEDPKPEPAPAPTTETLHGIRVELLVPAKKPGAGYSLLLFFHGKTGNGKEAVAKLAPFVERGFVLAAPWAKQGEWTAPEIESVRAIAKDLLARYEVPRERRHVGGLWTGSDGIPALAFDESLGFRTATWVDASWSGGSVPKWAKDGLSALFLYGGKEGPSRADRYRKSASMLSEKARISLAHGENPEPGLPRGREEPDLPVKELPFWGYFMESMEGRFDAARDLSRDWMTNLPMAKDVMAERKTGGMVFVHEAKPDAVGEARARTLQNEVLFDRTVRHFADQLVCVRMEKAEAKELLEAAKVTETPAVIVFRKGGKEILKSVAGEITARSLVPLLRAAAPDQEMPR
jgi:hypothetical protein